MNTPKHWLYMKEACGGWVWNSGELKTVPTDLQVFVALHTSVPPGKTKQNSPSLTARKPVLTGGLQALASQRLHPPAPSLLASSVCDLRTTSPIKPCADTCPSPEVREAPSGVGKRECGVSPALGLQTAVSVALVTCGLVAAAASWRARAPVELVTSSVLFPSPRGRALRCWVVWRSLALGRGRRCGLKSLGFREGAGRAADPAQSLRWGFAAGSLHYL